MDIPVLTNDLLKTLHNLVREKLIADDALPEGQKRWGIREYPDWKQQADVLETELRKRQIFFTPIDWFHGGLMLTTNDTPQMTRFLRVSPEKSEPE